MRERFVMGWRHPNNSSFFRPKKIGMGTELYEIQKILDEDTWQL